MLKKQDTRVRLLHTTAVSAIFVLGLAGGAFADSIEYYPISTNPSDWQIDRDDTSSFTLLPSYQGRSNVLALETKAVESGSNSFYQWEGYSQKTTLPEGDSFIGGDIWITDGWQQGTNSDFIRTGMWGSAMTAEEVATGNYNDDDAVFPIIQFTNMGGAGHLEVWDPGTNTTTGWIDLPETASLIRYDGWNTIDMRLVTNDEDQATAIQYYFNGQLIYTWQDPESDDGTTPEQYFAMYLKNRNHGGTDFTAYWSNLLSGLFLEETQTEIGDTPGDVLINDNDNEAVTITPGANIGGSISIRSTTQQKQVVKFSPNVTVQGGITTQNGTIVFPTGDTVNVTVNGNLILEDNSNTTGGTATHPVQFTGSGTVGTGSTLGGNLAFGQGLTNQGNLDPGNSIGVITVGTDLTLGPSSVYNVEVDLAGNADLIDVGGVATLDGVVSVDVIDGYLLNYDYTILTADGGFNGTRFDSDTPIWNNLDDFAFVSPLVSYDANNVYLTVMRNGIPFSSYAQTPNQAAVADALETLGTMSPPPALYNDIVLRLTVNDAPSVYNALSPEIYASASTAMIDQAHYIQDAVTGRLQQSLGGVSTKKVEAMSYAATTEPGTAMPGEEMATESAFGAWGYAYGGWTDWHGNSNAGKLKSSSGGFLTGIDGGLGDTWRVGVLAGYGYTSFDNRASASGESEAYTIGAYAGGQWPMNATGGLALRSGLSYTWSTPSVDRNVSFTGFSDRLKGEYDAGTLQIFGELAYEYKPSEEIGIEPYANLSYVNFSADSFTETGATSAALAVDSDEMNTYFTTVGLRASTSFDLGQAGSTAYLDLGWRHAFGDTSTYSTAAFVGSSPFTVSGVPLAEDTAVIGTGIDFAISEMASLGVSYIGQFGSGMSQNSVNARLDVKF